jgi:hypothetical protein
MGFAALAVIAPVAYRSGVTVTVMFGIACTAAVLVLAWRGQSLVRRGLLTRRADRYVARVVIVSVVAATVILILPRWVGGDQFAVFQGNQSDTYGYLEPAVVFARRPYAEVIHTTDEVVRQNPLYEAAYSALTNRPSVQLLYAVFGRVAPGQAYRLYYAYLVGCFVQLLLVTLFIVRNLLPAASLFQVIAVSLVYPLGFWGQYVFDINAWSQIAAAPALLLMTALLIHSAVLREKGDSLAEGLTVAAALAVTVAGAVYLYPEGFLIYAAAVVPIAAGTLVLRFVRARSISLTQLVPLAGLAGVGAAWLYKPLLVFLSAQVAFTSGGRVNWWQFFQVFFRGRDRVNGSSFEFVIDFAAGLFGLYFATPGPDSSAVAAATLRITIVVTIVALLVAFGLVVAGRTTERGDGVRLRASRELLMAWTAALMMLLLPAVYFAWNGNYWPAGKVVSYAAPVFMLLLVVPVAYEFRDRWLRPLRWMVCAFVAFQVGSGATRIAAAAQPDGIHYDAPYPAIQDRELKTGIGWDLGGLERVLTPQMHVRLRRMNLWLDHHLMVFLWSRGIPFVREGEFVNRSGITLDPLPATDWPDVDISASGRELLLHFRDGRPDVQVPCGKDPR